MSEMDHLTEMDIRWGLVHELRQALGLAEALMALSSAEVTHPRELTPEQIKQRGMFLGVARRICAAELIKHRDKVLSAFDNWSKTL